MKRSTLALVDSEEQARAAIERLTSSGFSQNDVSVWSGALIGLGVPEHEAKRYQGALQEGGILISVHTDSSDRAEDAERIFEETGAHDISITDETRADDRAAGGRDTDVAPAQDTATFTGIGRTGDVESVNPDAPAQDVSELGLRIDSDVD
ncbi:MAG: hypothetical protein JOY92_10555 [Verrucomicrobia bacterium]|nr:hypothetical protein [Verrucomicrobiota bacterium]